MTANSGDGQIGAGAPGAEAEEASDAARPSGASRAESATGVEAAGVSARGSAAPQNRGARKQLLLRLDPSVHAALARWAADDLRSVNAQIEMVLRRALLEAGRDPRPQPMRGRGRPSRAEGEQRESRS